MEIIETVFGKGRDLSVLQMSARAVVIFFITLIYIRVAGKRVFGRISTFDYVITITLGALLSRAIVGVSPFVPVIVSSFVFIMLNRLVAWLCLISPAVGRIVKGRSVSLYRDGSFNQKNMKEQLITERDTMEGIRKELNEDSLNNVDEIILERNGEMSVLKKKKEE